VLAASRNANSGPGRTAGSVRHRATKPRQSGSAAMKRHGVGLAILRWLAKIDTALIGPSKPGQNGANGSYTPERVRGACVVTISQSAAEGRYCLCRVRAGPVQCA
jgi:hypothetical protein